ncbi:GntR family transcriptional regulator [Umezawaea sp. NPDC059074]|uniref:GntR family transcriptional regulator n=1 Tax=Umezawaea sp. NPDC059074 TaxID=3346716 RepID=UPI0036C8A805
MNNDAMGPSRPRSSLKRHEVAGRLREAILAGEHPTGSLLPGENELARRFAVSRSTIRGALEGLARDNLIETQTGVGSFVTFDGRSLDESPSWGLALAMTGIHTRAEVVRMERVVDPDLAATVGSRAMEFLALDRIRRLTDDGTAVSLERSRVPAVGALAQAPELGLKDDSLSETMTAAGLVPARGDQWIAVAALGEADARLLGREPGETFLHTTRIARDADGNFVEKVVSWLDPKRFRLHVSFGA